MDHLSEMAIFAKVVEQKGFSAAARVLGLSKSAVSKQVSRLENRLGARLLNRTTRSLALTEVGQAFYERAARVLAEAEEAELAVTRMQDEPRGTLRVNAPVSFGIRHLAPLLPEFLTRYPDLAVDLSLNDRVVDMIDEGFDLAVRIVRLPDSSLVARKLAPFRRVVCASPEYWTSHGKPRHPEDLSRHACLLYSYLPNPGRWEFAGPRGPFEVQVEGRLSANNGEALVDAAVAGLGVVYSPTFIAGEALRDGRLEPVLNAFEERDRGIYAVYPHNRHLSAKVRLFVDFLAGHLGPVPPWDRGF